MSGACTKPVPLGEATGTSTTCPSGTSRLAQVVLVPVGQSQPVAVGQAYWNRLCLSQWAKQAGCTKPVPLGLGEVKRDLSLCQGTSHIPTMIPFLVAWHKEFLFLLLPGSQFNFTEIIEYLYFSLI